MAWAQCRSAAQHIAAQRSISQRSMPQRSAACRSMSQRSMSQRRCGYVLRAVHRRVPRAPAQARRGAADGMPCRNCITWRRVLRVLPVRYGTRGSRSGTREYSFALQATRSASSACRRTRARWVGTTAPGLPSGPLTRPVAHGAMCASPSALLCQHRGRVRQNARAGGFGRIRAGTAGGYGWVRVGAGAGGKRVKRSNSTARVEVVCHLFVR